ncbi:DNA repair protein RecO [Patescibacteria group bacterium]|nr:DNA repair protein RecO [Patescibacteria group bacterium]
MIKTKAIILFKKSSNEYDNVISIYSEELGKIFISAKGTKKIESKLRYSIEPISFVQLILVEGKNFLILKDAFLLDQFLNIKKDLEKLKKANQLNDLINNAFPEQEKDEGVWKLILKTFKDLDKKVINIKEFEKDLIQLLGYDKDMDLKDIY